MMRPKIIYCQDALCGWCYAFSPVMKRIAADFSEKLEIEVLAGGMVVGEQVRHFSEKAEYILGAIPRVEEMSGVKFGAPFLAHLKNPLATDWRPDSEPPAIATAIFKEKYPERTLEFAADLNAAIHRDGLDLSKMENYHSILEKYKMEADELFIKMSDEKYVERAHYDFFLCQQLQVSGYPTVFLQTDSIHFYLLSRGYSSHEDLKKRTENALSEWVARDN